ncbi:hypothetical protein LTR37_000958 [Vermiconidia calcicola]|uniref:Uncharacterized protein n=1 Tax=Vermiconidia calcicola TaxID=1690605 RepID=A0ACC3NYD5_9PEZI|nr:hypothetical protein LTR37_000958 [Vermiconidia calcicola]
MDGTDARTTAQKRVGFLDLPAELRNYVYELAMASRAVTINYFREECRDFEVLVMQPPITRTSRQIREEALPLYYQRTTSYMDTTRSGRCNMGKWLHAIGSENRPQLQRFYFDLFHGPLASTDIGMEFSARYLTSEASSSGLKSVEFADQYVFELGFSKVAQIIFK